MIDLTDLPYYFVLLVAAMSTVVTTLNLRNLYSLGDFALGCDIQDHTGTVSVLVPARNEEGNIGHCLAALTTQDYRALEILILDDQSTDGTREVVDKFAKSDPRVRIVQGTAPPIGWSGKNWACHQLSREATGVFLLFADADTVLSEETVSRAVRESTNSTIDLLTVMPRRTASCITERLLFPFIDWATFCWLPVKTAHESQNPHLSASFGQFMFFRRESYLAIGGHAEIRGNHLDDFELGRATKRLGMKWMLFAGPNSVKVRAYKGNIDAFTAISRSLFPALDYRVSVLALLSIVLLGLGFLPPLTLLFGNLSHPEETASLLVAIASIGMIATPWLIVCRKFKHNALMSLLYPLSIGLMIVVAFHSLATHAFGITNWKGRRLTERRVRL